MKKNKNKQKSNYLLNNNNEDEMENDDEFNEDSNLIIQDRNDSNFEESKKETFEYNQNLFISFIEHIFLTKYFFYLIEQIWIYFNKYNLHQIFSIIFEIIVIGINSYAFYLYFLSLEGCFGTQVECLDKFKPEYFYYLGFMCIYSSLIITLTTTLSFWNIISPYHSIYILIVMIYFYFYDNGSTLANHGQYNFFIFLVIFFISFIILTIIALFIKLSNKCHWCYNALIIFIILIISIQIFITIENKSNCSDWDLGLNNTRIDNNKIMYSCEFSKPKKCRMNFYDNLFDLTYFVGKTCDKIKDPKKEHDILIEFLDKNIYGNTKKFGFPITVNMNLKYQKNLNEFNEKVLSKLIDMNNETHLKFLSKNEMPEVTLEFNDDFSFGKINISLIKNEEISKERKEISKNTNSKFENILFLYIDSISRAHFKRKMKKTSQFIEKFMKYNKKSNYSSYQFLKYHNFAAFTQINVQPMFYGTNMYTAEGKSIIKNLKDMGFITGQSLNLCSKEVFAVESHYFVLNVNFSNFDHENIGMFCDPNYYNRKDPYPINRGAFSIIRRCLYNKDTFEYVIEYGKQFWEKYYDNKKFLRLGFIDAHEGSGEVIKYLDEPLYNFLMEFYNNGYLKNTSVFIISDHGNNMPGFYNAISSEDFVFEKTLGVFYLILYNFKNDKELLFNQQTFITPYDIYDTLINIIYNENSNITFYTGKGDSVLNSIKTKERNCKKYFEMKKDFCRCIDYIF